MSAPVELRLHRPTSAAQRLGDAAACPIDLRRLIDAAAGLKRPIVAFRPPFAALGSASAGILRAARERRACVALILEVAETPSQALGPILQAVAAASDDAGFDWPLGLLSEGPTLWAEGDVEPARERLSALIEAGLSNAVLRLRGSAPLAARWLSAAAEPAREQELSWALRPEGELPASFAAGEGPALVWLDPRLVLRDGRPTGRAGWVSTTGGEPASVREALVRAEVALVEAPLELPPGARGERAEALAYFAADRALVAWDVEETAPRMAAALLERWGA